MNGISLINSKAARTIIYVFFVGGLLNLSAACLWFIWNYGLIRVIHFSTITYLEAVGLIAFMYVFYFAYKFGEKKEAEVLADAARAMADGNDKNSQEIVRKMTRQEKDELRQMIARSCGMEELDTGRSSSVTPNYENFNPFSPLKQKKKIR